MKSITKKSIVFLFLLLFVVSIFLIQEKNKLLKQKQTLLSQIEVLTSNQSNQTKKEQDELDCIKQQWQDLKIQRDLLLNESLKLQQDIKRFQKEIAQIEKR